MRITSYSGKVIRIALKFDNASSSRFQSLMEKLAPEGHAPFPELRLRLFSRLPVTQQPQCEELLSGIALSQTPFPVRLSRPFLVEKKQRRQHVSLRATSPELAAINEKIASKLGHPPMLAERQCLGLNEVRKKKEPMVVAFQKLEKEDAKRIKEELEKIFPEEPTSSPITFNAIGFSIRERQNYEHDVASEDLPDKEFLFLEEASGDVE